MTGPAGCQLLGQWRIVESNIWDDDYLDLVGPATILFFRWAGCDEGDEVTGSGTAQLADDGTLEIELSFDNGDDAVLKARRE